MSSAKSETVIFNINKNNSTDLPIPLVFSENRNQNIIDNIEEYYIRVLEAKIPITEIPYFIMKPNKYSVTINGKRVFLVPPVGSLPEFNGQIFYFQTFLDSLNNALLQAHNMNGYTLASAPYFYYDNSDEYVKMVVDYQYFTLQSGGKVSIFFNGALLFKLAGFNNNYYFGATNGEDYQIIYDVYATNYFASGISDSINYECVVMSSENKFFSDLLEFQSLIITTETIPINDQYISSSNGVNRSFRILAVVPLKFENINKTRYLSYVQEYPRWVKTTGFGALRKIDCQVYVVGDDFSNRRLSLLPSENFNLRLEFAKKILVDNYEQ